MTSVIKIGDVDWSLESGQFRVTNVQFSGSQPGGHGSASFEVPVQNAYIAPHHTLVEGAWISISDNAHELYEGEILSITPSVDSSGQHKLVVACGGLLAVASKRADVSATWVHRGSEGWIRRPGTPQNLGNVNFDNGTVDLRVSAGTSQNYSGASLQSVIGALYYLDNGLSDDTISYIDIAGSYSVLAESALNWTWAIWTSPTIANADWAITTLTATSTANATYTGSLAVPSGTKSILLQLYCPSGWSSGWVWGVEKYVSFSKFDIYGMNRFTKARIDEAMVQLATRPGLAISSISEPIGPEQDDLRLGNYLSKVSTASGLDTLAALHSQPFEWGYWDNRTFIINQMPDEPRTGDNVFVVGGGNPGLESWDVAEYDEDVSDFLLILFGNKDDPDLPEGWPRRMYRPYTPADTADVRVEVIDYSTTILSDEAAAAIGGTVLMSADTDIPDGQIFDAHPGFANGGISPGNNVDPTTVYVDHYNQFISGNLSAGFGGTLVIGGVVTGTGAYTVHTFTSDSALIVLGGGTISAEVFIVGGGGGGSVGGGGGGGVVLQTGVSLSGAVSVVIGQGGAPGGGVGYNNFGANGTNSSAGGVVALGGGGGGKAGSNGLDGGCGGGAGIYTPYNLVGGAGSQGYKGGDNLTYYWASAGGGGAGAVGGNLSVNGVGGNGGAGLNSSFSGVSTNYAGGGGGHASGGPATPGTGGVGGGGNGGNRTAITATAGAPNTGGGGGGGYYTVDPTGAGKAGGSGIVIIRYLTASLAGSFNSLTGWGGSNSVLDPSCLTGDGVNDYVSFGDVAAADPGTGPFSVRQWLKLSTAPIVNAPVIAKLSGYQGWALQVTKDRQLLGYVGESLANYRMVVGTTVLAVDTWYHAVLSYAGSGGEVTLYLNGSPETTTTFGAMGAWNLSNSAPLQLFRQHT